MPLRFRKLASPIDTYKMLLRLQVAAALGCVFILFYSWQFFGSGFLHVGSTLRIASVGILIAGASLFLGFVLGFIFCVPRIPKQSADARALASAGKVEMDSSRVESNTNLVEISDWLTKMLVGVGLVELYKIAPLLKKLATFLGPGLRECDSTPCIGSSESFAIGLVVFFFGVGFLIGYVWTSLYYFPDLRDMLGGEKREEELWQLSAAARTLLQDGRFDESLRIVDVVLKIKPTHPEALFEKGRILKKLAQVHGKPGDKALLQEALDYASRAAAQMPNRGGPIYNIACYEALLGLGRDEVLKNLKLAIQLNPELREKAPRDDDFVSLWEDPEFKELTKEPPSAS
jgi:tetratricopeptide (TPR) repeat protein